MLESQGNEEGTELVRGLLFLGVPSSFGDCRSPVPSWSLHRLLQCPRVFPGGFVCCSPTRTRPLCPLAGAARGPSSLQHQHRALMQPRLCSRMKKGVTVSGEETARAPGHAGAVGAAPPWARFPAALPEGASPAQPCTGPAFPTSLDTLRVSPLALLPHPTCSKGKAPCSEPHEPRVKPAPRLPLRRREHPRKCPK